MWYHRLLVPFKALGEKYGIQVDLVSDENGRNGILDISIEQLSTYDAVIFSRIIHEGNETLLTAAHIHQCGVKVIIDIDDFWHIDPTHKLAKAYKDQEIPKKTELSLNVADLVFTPTPYLTEAVRNHTNKVHTIKTCIDNSTQWTSTATSSTLNRFGWIGGVHHSNDIKILEKSINKVYQKLTGFQFCVGGFNYKEEKMIVQGKPYLKQQSAEYLEIEKIFTGNYNFVDEEYKKYLLEYINIAEHISYYKPYRRLWAKDLDNYGRLYDDLDICLVPLANTGKFNQYKSELKLIEAGTKGKMCIVSKVKPYTLIPEDCVHFIDPSDMNGWYKAIKYCIENPEYVKDKANKLQEYIKTNYVLSEQNELRYNLIKQML